MTSKNRYRSPVAAHSDRVSKPGEKADSRPQCGIFSSIACRSVLGGRAGGLRTCRFIAWLRSQGTWIFKRQGSSRNSAYTDKINTDYLNVRTVVTIKPDGSERVHEQVVVTPKGLAKLAQMLGVSLGNDPMGGATR